MKKNNYTKFVFQICLLIAPFFVFGADSLNIYPTNWWVGMKWNKVQVLIKSNSLPIKDCKVSINYEGVKVLKYGYFENLRYIYADLEISPLAKPGDITVNIESASKKTISVKWPLYKRREGKGTKFAQGVNEKDFIYLIMPDRFSNGDEKNDIIPHMRDNSLNRDSIYLRHGGDIQGIINHLDYFKELGVTTLWLTPVLENNQPNRTEHGYSFTNHYKIDERLGGEKSYLELSNHLHQKGMKLIQDAVYNHIGNYHFLFQEPPAADWFHQWSSYTGTSFKDQPLFDPYGSKLQKKITSDGWFTKEMPDLNQENPYVANFLIQHALWSVEKFGIDGWRIDTYIYNNLSFMNRCNQALVNEYPKISMFGETWVNGTVNQAYFVENTFSIPFKSNLQGATDFQVLFNGIQPVMNEKFGWNEGVSKLYTTLSQDFIYKNPNRNVIFLDNHDMTRFFSYVNEDIDKLKMGIGWLMTFRGIPQMYYGSEVLMKGVSNPDGWVRLDFPGGWKNDSKNAFTGLGLDKNEKEVLDMVKKLGNFRKNNPIMSSGKLMQFTPKDGVYVYFRYNQKQALMCIMNTSEKIQSINFSDYNERTQNFTSGTDILTHEKVNEGFTILPKKMRIISLTH